MVDELTRMKMEIEVMMIDILIATIMGMRRVTWMAVIMRKAMTKANAVTCDTCRPQFSIVVACRIPMTVNFANSMYSSAPAKIKPASREGRRHNFHRRPTPAKITLGPKIAKRENYETIFLG